MSRVPIRLRLTLAFAVAMAVVLSGAGLLLYQHLATSLDRTLDQGLQARASDVSALVEQADTGLRESPPDPFSGPATGFAQVLSRGGRVFDATPGLGPVRLLLPVQLARAWRGPLLIRRARRGGGAVRLLALPVSAQDQRLVVVVGASLAARDGALARLRSELLLGVPAALLLASLIGYLVAAAALSPVERMRARAAAISASRLSDRLPVLPSRDEVSRLGETLNEVLARLETSLERERSFVADASHELRSPLANLRAEVELALEGSRSRSELATALRSIGEECDRLSQLAEDLLLLARLDQGALPIRRERMDVDRLLGDVAARFGRRARAAGRRIETDGGGCQITVDGLRLEQALSNLVENALRHGSGVVRVVASDAAGDLEFRVTDEGPGFPAELIPTALERFSRGDESRSTAGTGLGLAIVAAVADAHGGTVAVANRHEGGAVVSMLLPHDAAVDLPEACPGRPDSSEAATLRA